MESIGNLTASVNQRTIAAVHKAADEGRAAGLCLVPPSEDGKKRPYPNLIAGEEGKWAAYQLRRPTDHEHSKWFPKRSGLGIVIGPVSDYVEAWDFDDKATYEEFIAVARSTGLALVIDRIEHGYCDDTAGGGVRWLVRYPKTVERQAGHGVKLACRPKREDERKDPNDKVKTLIELPGYAVVAPSNGSVHPSGKPYCRRSGSFATIASYAEDEGEAIKNRDGLIALARSFDISRKEQMADAEPKRKAQRHGDDLLPGDDFNDRASWEMVLVGWKKAYTTRAGETYWIRPGKTAGPGATTNYGGHDKLKVFTTSTVFEADKNYSKFAAYAVLNHGGDFGAGARALARQGYGKRSNRATQQTASSPKASPSTQQDQNEDEDFSEVGEYRQTRDGIFHRRFIGKEAIWSRIANFRARIAYDIIQDDGVETTRAVELETKIHDRSHTFTVSAAQFNSMNWVLEQLGAEAAIEPGQGTKDRVRHAIQVLSGRIPQRRVFTHTGWSVHGGKNVFLHAGGAIGPDGPVADIEVDLPVALRRFVFPFPPVGTELREAVLASLVLRNVAPDNVIIPLIGSIYRAPRRDADYSNHLSGRTGTQKTEVTALCQQHYGAEMNARSLPCSWSSTENALEATAFAAKDVPLGVDDFVPQGSSVDRARHNAKADRVIRAQGNRSGRDRMRSDTTLRRARWPRGLILSTGEETPTGQSLRARLAVAQVQPGDVNLEQLTIAQALAGDGTYAKATAGYIKWLAPRLDSMCDEFRTIRFERRKDVDVAHARTADVLAQIYASWVIWLKFVVEVGATTNTEADTIKAEVWAVLTALGKEQQELQRADDPVERFFALLCAVLSSGAGHIASAANPDRRPSEAVNPLAVGWRQADNGAWHPQGSCLGWWADDGIYLQPEASYAAAQKLGNASGESIGVASQTLHKRMHERGLLLSTERRGGETRLKVRKNVGGQRTQVLHVGQDLATPYAGTSGPSGPDGPAEGNE